MKTQVEHLIPLLTAKDLAALLGISRANVYRYRSEGKDHLLPPPVMIGAQPRWRAETVAAWLKEKETGNDVPA